MPPYSPALPHATCTDSIEKESLMDCRKSLGFFLCSFSLDWYRFQHNLHHKPISSWTLFSLFIRKFVFSIDLFVEKKNQIKRKEKISKAIPYRLVGRSYFKKGQMKSSVCVGKFNWIHWFVMESIRIVIAQRTHTHTISITIFQLTDVPFIDIYLFSFESKSQRRANVNILKFVCVCVCACGCNDRKHVSRGKKRLPQRQDQRYNKMKAP